MFNLELDKVVQEVNRRKARRVLVQIPYGLRREAFQIADNIKKKTLAEVVISANPCHGACDLATNEAEQIDADLILHMGHAAPPGSDKSNILFIETRASVDIAPIVGDAIRLLEKERRIGLMATVQHIQALDETKRILESSGKIVMLPRKSGKISYDGQILGCDFEGARVLADQVDAFLVISGGNFHGLGIQISTGKRTLVCDPFSKEVRDMSDLARKFLMRRYAAIDAFKRANKVGVLIVTKNGQLNLKNAFKIKEVLEKRGHTPLLLSVNEIQPMILESFSDMEAFLNTGCPRVALDDQDMYSKPVLTYDEALIAADVIPWEEYVKENSTSKRA